MKRKTFASISAAPRVRSGLKQLALSAVLTFGLMSVLAFPSQAQVRAWGENANGQIGDGTTVTPRSAPVTLSSLLTADITAFSGGELHTLALRSDGTVVAWGQNFYGQRGDGTTDTIGACACNPTPGAVSGLTNVVAVSADGFHSLAVRADGTVWAWGNNDSGRLGDGTTTDRTTPVQVGVGVTGFDNIVAVEAGRFHSVALKSDGTVWAWGRNDFGQARADSGVGANALSPVQISGVTNVISIAAGENHSIVVQGDGNVYGWGNNQFGQLGDGTTTGGGCGCLPVTQSSIIGVAKVAAGFNHTAALKQDGTVWAWGRNFNGEIGNGTTITSPPFGTGVPAQASGLASIADVRTSGTHNIARRKDGTLFSWGQNFAGQVTANGTTSSEVTTPVSVPVGTTDAVFGTTYYTSYVSAPAIPTNVGTNVSAVGENFTLTFANVTTGGSTTAQAVDPAAQPFTVPTGFRLQNNVVGYNLTTTAVNSGNFNVCLTVPSVHSQVLFNALILFHGEGSNWVDRTTSRDYRKRQVCGTVTSLGAFAIGRANVVTAAGVMVGGRVMTGGGKPIRGALVTMIDAQGNSRTVVSNFMGYYRLADVPAGGTYVFSVTAKRYSFSQQTQIRQILSETDDIDFTADGYKGYLNTETREKDSQ